MHSDKCHLPQNNNNYYLASSRLTIAKCAVVILYYNTSKMTCKAIQACIDAGIPEGHIILVDNNSIVEPVDGLTAEFPSIILLRNSTNLGFSCGINVGIRHALDFLNTPYVAIVNSDLYVGKLAFRNAICSLDQIKNLLPIGALTGKILYENGNQIWMAGGKIDMIKVSGIPYGYRQDDHGQWDQACLTGWASGAFSIFTSNALRHVGLFSEDFFFGQEEWDLSLRLLKSGYYIYYDPNVVSKHVAGGSYKSSHPVLNTFNGYCNKVIIARKHLSRAHFFLWLLMFEARTLILIPLIAFRHSRSISDFLVQCKAILLALILSPFVVKTDLGLLTTVTRLIGTSSSWSKRWTA